MKSEIHHIQFFASYAKYYLQCQLGTKDTMFNIKNNRLGFIIVPIIITQLSSNCSTIITKLYRTNIHKDIGTHKKQAISLSTP